jgi:hypothetical protein
MTTDFRKQVEALLPLAGTGVEYRVAYTDESAAQLVDAIVKLHEAEVEQEREHALQDFCLDIQKKVDWSFNIEHPERLTLPWEQTVRPIIYAKANEAKEHAAIEPKKEGE